MFNAADYASEGTQKEIAEGWTDATIDEVVSKESKAGNKYVSVRFNLDNYGGRKMWENLNVRHSREDVREIAYRILANMCIACGFSSIADESNPVELEGKSLKIFVGRDKNGDQAVKSYKLADDMPGRSMPEFRQTQAATAPVDSDIPF
jgi:hypothetical protein